MTIEERLEVLEKELKSTKRTNRFLLIALLIIVGFLPIGLAPVKADEGLVSKVSDLENRMDSLESEVVGGTDHLGLEGGVTTLDEEVSDLKDRLSELETKVGDR